MFGFGKLDDLAMLLYFGLSKKKDYLIMSAAPSCARPWCVFFVSLCLQTRSSPSTLRCCRWSAWRGTQWRGKWPKTESTQSEASKEFELCTRALLRVVTHTSFFVRCSSLSLSFSCILHYLSFFLGVSVSLRLLRLHPDDLSPHSPPGATLGARRGSNDEAWAPPPPLATRGIAAAGTATRDATDAGTLSATAAAAGKISSPPPCAPTSERQIPPPLLGGPSHVH